jgi:hypothetical protein
MPWTVHADTWLIETFPSGFTCADTSSKENQGEVRKIMNVIPRGKTEPIPRYSKSDDSVFIFNNLRQNSTVRQAKSPGGGSQTQSWQPLNQFCP